MFNFLKKRYLRDGSIILKNADRVLRYRRDLLPATTLATLQQTLAQLRDALHAKAEPAVAAAIQHVDQAFGRHIPPHRDATWRENTEVILVAIILALAVRAYFLQPFTIPTGSMQPTLNGIIGVPTTTPLPNPIIRAWDLVLLGRSYFDVTARTDEEIVNAVEKHRFRFFTFTELQCRSGNRYRVPGPLQPALRDLGLGAGKQFRAGQTIARGYFSVGDHVFVDKLTYHFRRPRRGEVFVFKTTGIRFIEQSLLAQGLEGSQYYIKRLVGLPGDVLRIVPPALLVNGRPATEPGMRRVTAAADGYRGYTFGPRGGPLGTPDAEFKLPPGHYFAMGDNSFNSSDSRYWGTVAQSNLAGSGCFVYWPFTRHFGPIR